MSMSCPEPPRERSDRVEIKCVNCDQPGHRVRDCPEPRKDRFACRNCGQSGHKASECTEPRSADNVECRHCNEKGHFAKDCPTKPLETCRNCGEEGHRSKECTNAPNPAMMQCRNCDESMFTSASQRNTRADDVTQWATSPENVPSPQTGLVSSVRTAASVSLIFPRASLYEMLILGSFRWPHKGPLQGSA